MSYDTCIIVIVQKVIFVSTPGTKPEWREFIESKDWDEFNRESIAECIALHSAIECNNFAYLLLNNCFYVNATCRKHPDNEGFVIAVLDKWYTSVGGHACSCTWKECMKSARLDGGNVQNHQG